MFLAWGVVIALLVILSIPFTPEKRPLHIAATGWLLWIASYGSFLAAFWFASRATSRPPAFPIAWQTASVLAILFTPPALGLEGALLVPIAFQLGSESRTKAAIAWIALQSLAMFLILDARFVFEHALSVFAAYAPFQFLAFYTSRVVARESSARQALARVNAELLATREMLAANSRAAERLRISRELHDVFGHRLAALSVNLEAATRVPEADKPRFIGNAHESAKALLSDVREVVMNLRRDAPVDFQGLVRSVVRNVPQPAIHLDCPDPLPLDSQSAHLLLRCTQEVVTNAIRHAASENLWMQFRVTNDGLAMAAWDDGRGAPAVNEGCGLRGIRERIESAGGSMRVETKEGDGFRVNLLLPGVTDDSRLSG